MAAARIIEGYKFDLAAADAKLNNAQCRMLIETIRFGNEKGKGNVAIDAVIAYCVGLGIARRHGNGAGFKEFVSYLKKRA